MRGTGLKVSGNILVLIRTTVVLPSRRIEGSPRRVRSHRETEHPRHRRTLGAHRGRGESAGGCGQEEGTHGGPGAEPSARDHQGGCPGGRAGMGRTRRDGQRGIAHRPGQPPEPSAEGGPGPQPHRQLLAR